MTKKILLTGGGSAGHVIVNTILIPVLIEQNLEVFYVGSFNGIEKELIAKVTNIPYYAISTGKLRRYFDWNNFLDLFRVLKGTMEAYRIISKEKPDVVFSKGGFVSVPVVLGSWLNNVPVIIHESDLTPGLANRIAMHFADRICTTFPQTVQSFPKNKGEFIGAIVRPELKEGNSEIGSKLCGFDKEKPVIFVAGGSLGSVQINNAIRKILTSLLPEFQIIHICGKGNIDSSLRQQGYKQFEYVADELPHLMSLADLVISRAGSNFIFEFLSLKKPMILIPLPKGASRGDQLENAQFFQEQGFAEVIFEENLTPDRLLQVISSMFTAYDRYVNKMNQGSNEESLAKLLSAIKNTAFKVE